MFIKNIIIFIGIGLSVLISAEDNPFLAPTKPYPYDRIMLYNKEYSVIEFPSREKKIWFTEDLYNLYAMNLQYSEPELFRNIFFLKLALISKFRNPEKALCPITSKEQYKKYQYLLYMQINYMIMRNFLRIGAINDRENVHFYDVYFGKEFLESLDIAIYYYKNSFQYWNKALDYAKKAYNIFSTVELNYFNNNMYDFVTGEVNFKNIIQSHIDRAEKKKAHLKELLAKTTYLTNTTP